MLEAWVLAKVWWAVRAVVISLSALPWLLPLASLAGCAGAVYAMGFRRDRRAAGWMAGILLVTGAGDGLVLAALPWLGVSFGPVGLPWLAMVMVRAGMAGAIQLPRLKVRRGATAVKIGLLGAASVLLLAAEVYALYVEPLEVTVTRRDIVLPGLAPAEAAAEAAPVRLVQLSDLHIERVTARETTMLAAVQALKPDLIVLTGDYLNLSYINDAEARQAARAVLGQLQAPYGVYAVRGTVDNAETARALFAGLDNVVLLTDEVRPVTVRGQTLYLLGVTDAESIRNDGDMLHQLMRQMPPDVPTILLYHTPDLIETAAAEGVDLYLAGHTHGGQVRLPWYGALITASRFGKRYEAGYYRVGPTQLYVSRGLGMEGLGAPRVRFLCPPEVVALDAQIR